jgi:hypothetical protein
VRNLDWRGCVHTWVRRDMYIHTYIHACLYIIPVTCYMVHAYERDRDKEIACTSTLHGEQWGGEGRGHFMLCTQQKDR